MLKQNIYNEKLNFLSIQRALLLDEKFAEQGNFYLVFFDETDKTNFFYSFKIINDYEKKIPHFS